MATLQDRYNPSRKVSVDDAGALLIRGGSSDGSVIVNANNLSNYILQDLDEASDTVTYLGKETNGGTWLIVKLDSTSGLEMRYANESNNSSYTAYSDAWTNRATLTFDLLEDLTGV